jgi:hypothetical protein
MGNKQSTDQGLTTTNVNASGNNNRPKVNKQELAYERYAKNDYEYEKAYNEMVRDKGDYYVGSALRYIPKKYTEVNAEYLRNNMPNSHLPKKTPIVEYLNERITLFMIQKSKEDKLKCEYEIPTLVPGFPPIYNKDEIMEKLIPMLMKLHPGITVIPSKTSPHTLIITWVNLNR